MRSVLAASPCLPRLAGRVSFLSARSLWTVPRTQEVLNQHRQVSDCVVTQNNRRVAHVVKSWRPSNLFQQLKSAKQVVLAPEVTAPVLTKWLKANNYEGPEVSFSFVSSHDLDALGAVHGRVVMRDIVHAVFSSADKDGDGLVSLIDMIKFSEEHGLELDSPWETFAEFDDDVTYDLNYGEFKTLLRDSSLLLSEGKDGHFGTLYVADSLLDIVVEEIFFKADADKTSSINLGELQEMWQQYWLGDADAAKSAFDKYSTAGALDLDAFQKLVVAENVVQPMSQHRQT